jgi:hypothetical protein
LVYPFQWVLAFEIFIPLVLFFILLGLRQKKPTISVKEGKAQVWPGHGGGEAGVPCVHVSAHVCPLTSCDFLRLWFMCLLPVWSQPRLLAGLWRLWLAVSDNGTYCWWALALIVLLCSVLTCPHPAWSFCPPRPARMQSVSEWPPPSCWPRWQPWDGPAGPPGAA